VQPKPSARGRRRRRSPTSAVKATALVLLGTGLALLAVEIVLRATGFGAVRPQMAFDPNTRAVLRAGDVVVDKKLLWRESPPGPDDPERELHVIRVGDTPPPKTKKVRLLCLGDSCTRLAPGGLPYSRLIEEQLGPNEVEVFNASLPGYSSFQGLAWLRLQLLDYQAEVVIVYFGWNDHWRTTGFTDRELARRLAFWRPRILNLLQRPHHPAPRRVPLDEFTANLREIARLVAERGGKTVFVTAPYNLTPEAVQRHVENGYALPGEDVLFAHAKYVAAVRKLSEEPGARVVDAARIFPETHVLELLIMPDGIHPTSHGHQVLAAILADDIATHDMGEKNPQTNPVLLANAVLAQSLAAQGRWVEAIQRATPRPAEADIDVVLGHAWLLAACPVDSLRDPARALAELDAYQGPMERGYRFYDVRAAALAARGRYPEAVKAAEESLRLFEASGEEPRLAAGIRGRLERYRARQPYLLPAAR
jgi:lysophospholipase L1-like esterase